MTYIGVVNSTPLHSEKINLYIRTHKTRPNQWPSPCHKSKLKSTCTHRKHLSMNPSFHPSQSSNSALASSRLRIGLTSLIRKSLTIRPCPVSKLPLLMFYKTRSVPEFLGKMLHCSWDPALPQSVECFPLNKGHQTHYWIVLILSFDRRKCAGEWVECIHVIVLIFLKI